MCNHFPPLKQGGNTTPLLHAPLTAPSGAASPTSNSTMEPKNIFRLSNSLDTGGGKITTALADCCPPLG